MSAEQSHDPRVLAIDESLALMSDEEVYPRLLETEAVPPGYPVMHEYLPDVEGFYKGWLGREVPA